MALITRALTKTFWGIADADTSQDAVIDALILQCQARIETWCGRKFDAANFTDYLMGTGNAYLPLRQRPINSVASVYEDRYAYWGQADDAFAAATLLTAGTDYAIVKDSEGVGASGMLARIGAAWARPVEWRGGQITSQPGSTGNIKVTYNAGFSTIPYDLQQACLFLMGAVKRTIRIGAPIQSEGWEGYNYALAQTASEAIGGLPPDTAAVLSRYRNVALG